MTDKEIHQQFVETGAKAREWIHQCKLLLPEIARREIWREQGYSCISEYAAKLAGLSEWQVRDALRVLKRVEAMPALLAVAKEKGISAVRPVACLATPETEEFWAEKARTLGQRALQTYVRDTKFQEQSNSSNLQIGRAPNSLELRPDLVARLKKIPNLEAKLEQFLDQHEEKPEPVPTESRHIPARIRRYVLEKTGGLCAFPNCYKPYEILHHTQRFALERVHDPDRLVPLCKAHERLAHHNLIENEEGPAHTWKLRKNPDRNSPSFWIDQHVALYRPG